MFMSTSTVFMMGVVLVIEDVTCHRSWHGFAGDGAASSGVKKDIIRKAKPDEKDFVERIRKEIELLQKMENRAILYTAEGT